MPRMRGPRVQEKSKDFFGSMKRLFKHLRKWRVVMVIALFLALVSALLSLIAPNILSDFADEITLGIKPNVEVLSEINEKMFSSFTEENIKSKIVVINQSNISDADKKAFMEAMQIEDKSKILYMIPESVLSILLNDIKVEDTVIPVSDQVKMINLYKNVKDINDRDEQLKLINNLPKSVEKLVEGKIDMDNVKRIAILLSVVYFTSLVFSYIQNFSMTTVSNRFAQNLRSSISKKINILPLKYFDLHENGDLLSRLTNDVDTIGQNLNNSLASLVSSTTLFLGSIFMMFYTNWIMALTAIFSSLIGFMLMFMILGKSQKYFAASQKSLGDLNGYIEEIYSGHNVVKVYNGTEDAIETFDKLNVALYEAKRKSIFMSGTMQPIMGFVGNLGYVAVCIVGALLALNSYISFGVIVAFMIYVRLFTNPLSQIAQAMTSLQSTAAASERVFEFFDEDELSDQKHIKRHLKKSDVLGEIEFEHVKFGYDDNKIIIKDFNAKAQAGEKIAIVGPTGAGKTTMVNLLMKFYEINDGNIYIDGVNSRELTRENIHELFCMVLQDTWLFEGSIRDNIKFNKKNVTDDQIWDALKTVGVDKFVKTLPGGLDYIVGGDTDSISSGQKQLFTIARGMIEDSPFLILDEATSNVDTRTEELVQKAMDKLTKGRTSFIIAHRLSTIKNADLILVMKDGNIIETGNHEELLKLNGFYAELYHSQFKK